MESFFEFRRDDGVVEQRRGLRNVIIMMIIKIIVIKNMLMPVKSNDFTHLGVLVGTH
jgi:hypothetical protein